MSGERTNGVPAARPCAFCGTPFAPPAGRPRTRYCCRRCTWKAGGERRKARTAAAIKPVACGWCAAAFKPRPTALGRQVYCSAKCGDDARHARDRAARPPVPKNGPRPCRCCGEDFTPPTRRGCAPRPYCTEACRARHWRRQGNGRKPAAPQVCRFCGAGIEGTDARKRVCCQRDACRAAYFKAVNAEARRRKREEMQATVRRACAVCGETFAKWGPAWKKTCSPGCDAERSRRWGRLSHQRMMLDPDRHERTRENQRDAERRRKQDPRYRERERVRQRLQKRREAARERELAQLRDFDHLARAVGDDERATGP